MNSTKHPQTGLKILLILQTLALLGYTAYVGIYENMNFLGYAMSSLQSLSWAGQFSLDFTCYLLLSGLWIMWRNKYSGSSIAIAVVAMIIGIVVFAPYVLYLVIKEQGDLARVLVGDRLGE